MLLVDGMSSVMQHGQTVQWLYSLLGSKHRMVRKNALKLLLVFVEYAEGNCVTMVNAVNTYHHLNNGRLWAAWYSILQERDVTDWESLLLAMTFLNKVLQGLPDRATFLDVTDAVEQLGMEELVKQFSAQKNADLDFIQQLHVYETALRAEDGQVDSAFSSVASAFPAAAMLVRKKPRTANCDPSRQSYRLKAARLRSSLLSAISTPATPPVKSEPSRPPPAPAPAPTPAAPPKVPPPSQLPKPAAKVEDEPTRKQRLSTIFSRY